MASSRTSPLHHGCLSFAVIAMVAIHGVAGNKTAARPVLTMLTRVEEPLVFVREEGGKTAVEGFVPDFIKKLGDAIKMDVKIQVLPTNDSISTSAQTTEMLKRLEQGNVAVVGPLAMTYVNERVVDFTKPLLNYGIVPVAKALSLNQDGDDSYNFQWIPLPSEVFLILKPFSAGIWLLTIFGFVGVSVFLFLIYRFNPRERKTTIEALNYDEDFGLLGSFLFVFSTLVWQGYSRAPRSISGRILAAFWWSFALILIACYTAKLVFFLNASAMAAPSSQKDAGSNSLQDLADGDSVTFGVIKNSPEYYFFRQSRIAAYEKIWTKMSSTPDESFLSSPGDGFKRAREGKFVFLVNSLLADYVIGRKPCDLVQIGPHLSSTGMGLALKKGSAIKNKLSEGILYLRENGEIHKIMRKWWKPTCDSASQYGASMAAARARVRSMRVTEFGGAFILLLIGAVLAAIALLLEIIFVRRQRRKKQQTAEQKPQETVLADTPAETAKV